MKRRNRSLYACLWTLLFLGHGAAQAAQFGCSITDVLELSDNGSFVTHGWAALYQNREFTVDRASGKVIGTTALKVRLSNFNAEYAPQVLDDGSKTGAYISLTRYETTGQFALLQVNTVTEGEQKPFYYHTGIGMILTGLCVAGP